MVLLPYLRKGQKALEHNGDIYFVSADWNVFSVPDTRKHWYFNEATENYQFEFPLTDANKAISFDCLPKGWETFKWESEEEGFFVWWWNDEKRGH